jgi:NADPH:quinone reductase-like Zn-dependent oxidoreductase
VLVAVEAAGLNPSDTKIRAGGRPPDGRDFPYVAGREMAGRVLEVGPGVDGFAPGDRVFAFIGWDGRPGGHVERTVVPASALARQPAGIGGLEAAGLPLAGLTAWQALLALNPTPGARVLVTSGSGGVGHLGVQIAVARGFEVVATAGPGNLDFVRGLGATEVLDYRDAASDPGAAGIAFLLDSVGPANIARYQEHLAPGASVAAVAGLPAELRAGLAATAIRCRADGAQLADLSALLGRGALSVTVQEVFPLERVADAHRRLEAGHVRGKLVIDLTVGAG